MRRFSAIGWRSSSGCHGGAGCHGSAGFRGGRNKGRDRDLAVLPKIVLVGTPNVGKSVLFNSLTGSYVTVSNYPGTTVEVSRGRGRVGGVEYEIIDTPGIYSLLPITEEEMVTRRLLLSEEVEAVIHVVDAKNIDRMLIFTLQLIEAGLPVMLVLNMMDEAETVGVGIDAAKLEERLGIPVVPTAASLNRGIDRLKARLADFLGMNANANVNAGCHSRMVVG